MSPKLQNWVLSLLLLLLASLPTPLGAQQLHPFFRQFSTEDGLPSSEVYFVFQDREQYLWFGTDNGVARYDGYEFTVFDSDDGLEDVVVFTLLEDRTGKIWVSTYSGRIYYFENDRFHPYVHNEKLRKLKSDNFILNLVDIDSAGRLLFKIALKGFYRMEVSGEVVQLNQATDPLYFYTYRQSDSTSNVTNAVQQAHAGFYSAILTPERPIWEYDRELDQWTTAGFCYTGQAIPRQLLRARHNPGPPETILITNDSLIRLRRESPVSSPLAPISDFVYAWPHRESGIFLALDNGGGLQYLRWQESGRLIQRDTFLKNHSVSHGKYDHQGGLWVTTLDAGVFYSPRPELRTLTANQGFPDSKALSLALVDGNSFFAGYADGAVRYFRLDRPNVCEIVQERTKAKAFCLYYDAPRQTLYTNLSRIDVSAPWQATDYAESRPERAHGYSPFIHYTPIHRDSADWLLFASGSAFGRYDLRSQTIDNYFNTSERSERIRTIHTYHIDADGNHWLGTLNGLYRWDQHEEVKKDTLDHPALGDRIQRIVTLPTGAMLFGTRGRGLIYRAADTTYQLDTRDGLASNMVRDLHLAEDGSVWVATLTGLSKVSFDRRGRPEKIKTFRTAHGLPSNEIHDIDSYGGQVWLATSLGIVLFTEPLLPSIAPTPQIRSITVNGTEVAMDTFFALSHNLNDVVIRFGTIDYPMNGQIPYRYRLSPATEWQYTQQQQVTYANMSPGTYRFTVQSQSRDSSWSAAAGFDFAIAPPWYARWPFRLLGLLSLILIIWAIIQVREQNKRRELDFNLQMEAMEQSARHAQMNPHFVFNCLNSIQHFILNHDEKQAATYLARFARLIRNTLRVSIKGRHSLGQEITMLNDYLALEKLRFKSEFEYHLSIDEHLQPDAITLPPLLIQPFVENAIQHGLDNGERAGEVVISFSGSASLLQVTIRDNGRGIEHEIPDGTDPTGMQLTRRRLELINRHSASGQAPIQIRTVRNELGKAAGTEIVLYIATLSTPR